MKNRKLGVILTLVWAMTAHQAIFAADVNETAREKRPKKKIILKKDRSVTGVMTTESPAEPKKTVYKRKDTVSYWLKKMKTRVAKTEAKHNQLVAVAAVRGSETTDAPPLYWKGKKSGGPVDLPELKQFDEAVSIALQGDNASAISKLETFIAENPQSPLVADAQQTLKLLNDEATP